tara:strand:+ start:110 stop:619 length:510 start_codon:yes stop_codon:yes gene_type:complete
MGLQQVATTTIDSSSKTSSLSLTGINDDSVYLFTFSNMNVEQDITLGLRFTISGSPFAFSNYAFARKQMNANSTFSNVTGASQSFVNMSIVTDTTCFASGFMYLYDFNDSSEFSYCTLNFITSNSGSGDSQGTTGGAVLQSAGSADGVNFVTASGYEINSGVYSLFKVV